MVNVTTFMVATTAMVLGINALDVKAAEQIKMGLEDAEVIPASASVSAAASASASDVYKAAVESVLVQAAIVKAENLRNKKTLVTADSIFDDIIADFGKFIDSLLHPVIELPSVDLPDVALPSVQVPSVSAGLSIGFDDAASSSSSAAAKSTPNAKLKHNKRAIYDMDGSYSESSTPASVASNEYSAQDFNAASAFASASEIHYIPPAASVKAVLKARRSEAYASASSAWAASASASASADEAAISAAPEMWDQVMVHRSADVEVSEEDQVYSEAQFGVDLGDLIGDLIKDDIGKNIASDIKDIPKTAIDFDALRSSLLQQFSFGTSEAAEEASSDELPSSPLSLSAKETSSVPTDSTTAD
ncbi:uncharacterized protein ATC70_001650 [Mucor velutinosus]|uniref:Uncharacterized protein n=1 Tax=Mucor velutinosus TaxID=708070 RepID=A0AAN7DJQ9_9FUNG|nr:hypothetical protein ATC70_001650 [Mucor velutinosus]